MAPDVKEPNKTIGINLNVVAALFLSHVHFYFYDN